MLANSANSIRLLTKTRVQLEFHLNNFHSFQNGFFNFISVDDQTKRQEMEAKIRKELEHWDSSRPSTSDSVNN